MGWAPRKYGAAWAGPDLLTNCSRSPSIGQGDVPPGATTEQVHVFVSFLWYLFGVSPSCIHHLALVYDPGVLMIILKVLALAVLSALTWLVGNYTAEYFRPYKRN